MFFYSLKGTDNKVIGKRSQNNTNPSIALPNFVLSKYLFYFEEKIQEMMKNNGIYFNLKTINSAAPPPPPPLPRYFQKMCFSKKGRIFPENFMEISKIIQNIRRFSY